MSRRRKLVLATHNSHKKTEMNTLLAPLGISIVGLDDFPKLEILRKQEPRSLKTH